MKRLSLFTLLLFLVGVQLQAAAWVSQVGRAYERGELERALRTKILVQGNYSHSLTLNFLHQLEGDVLAGSGSEMGLSSAVKSAMEYLAKLGRFTAQELELAQRYYESLLMQHPELRIPTDVPMGLACIVTGLLFSQLPGAVMTGGGLISTGTMLFAEGLAQWEMEFPHQNSGF